MLSSRQGNAKYQFAAAPPWLSAEAIGCVPGKARLLNGAIWNSDTYFR
jgi:hypothetical protein